MTQLQRWLSLVREIDLRPGQSARQLAEKLGCSLRTIQRDLQRMPDELGIIPYNESGYRFHYKPFLEPLALSREEILSIILAQRLATKQLDQPTNEALTSAVDKMRQGFCAQDRIAADRLEHRTAIVSKPDTTSDTKHNFFQELSDAIQRHQQVYFLYQGRKDEAPAKRHVEPLGLSLQESRWYLHAYDLVRQGERTFRLARISELALTSVRFEPKTKFSTEQAEFHQWDLLKREPVPITLRVSPGLARWFEENKPHPSVRVEDTTITLSVTDPDAFLRWFVSLDGAELIEPIECRDAICRRLQEKLKLYNKQVFTYDMVCRKCRL